MQSPQWFFAKPFTDLMPQDARPAALEGIWDFDQANTVDPTTGLTAFSDDLRARAELGVKASFTRWTVSGEGFYDGIGADMDAYGGKVRAGLSLN